MTFPKLLAVLSLVVGTSAGSMVLLEQRAAAPSGFVRQGAAPANNTLTLRVALTSNNLAGLEEKLRSIATPGTSDFRQWLSKEEVKTFAQPSPETVSAFDAFASSNGLAPTSISPNGDWVALTLPVSQANQLFSANFEHFTHPSLTEPITRTLSVSLPSELVGHVDVIHPTTAFIPPDVRLIPGTPQIRKRGPAASCDTSDGNGVITPTCLQDLYGIPTTPATETSNAILITGYENEWAQQPDLSQFLILERPDMDSSTTFSLLTTDSGENPQLPVDAGYEANLDLEYTGGIATGVALQFLSVGTTQSNATVSARNTPLPPPGFDFGIALLDTTTFLDGIENPPSVMTTSYGYLESDAGASLATKICNAYMALGARGVSAVFSSGDGGVRGNHDTIDLCANTTFMPTFPSTCPFVTSVGATQGFAPEKAVNLSSGGFSNFFPTPDYQTSAVSGFLQTLPSDFAGIFNVTGRGYPDVSTQGLNFFSIVDQTVAIQSGPKPVLGFLNPWLYSTASSAFTDITTGHNSGFVCPASSVAFDATVGWDPLKGSHNREKKKMAIDTAFGSQYYPPMGHS
ncbi:family S53 protease-like protein [Mycena galopus ATCC 62051]|nr:family S53 protease-like protein [Mycena galopus ATCC 62051]